jgi:hypothetical protein
MYSQPSLDSTALWMKFSPRSAAGAILCSHKVDQDLGHRCLSTDEEGPADMINFAKFRWTLSPWNSSSPAYTISNAAFGGMLYVSDYSFDSSGLTMTSVYVRAISEREPCDLRHVWRIEELGDDACRVVSMFNNQVLCESCIVANSKGDRWVAVAEQQLAEATSYTFAMQVLPVGS